MANNIQTNKIDTSGQERWDVSYNVDQSGTKTGTLLTAGSLLDRNIKLNITTPAAGAMSLNITDKSTTNITIGTKSGSYYPLSTSLTGKATFASAGWITTNEISATDSSVIVGRIAAGSIVPMYTNSGLDTYFNSGSSSDYSIYITPQYTNTAGYIPAHSTAVNGDPVYLTIKQAGTMSLSITDKSTTNITVGTKSGNYYPLSTSLTGKATFASAGWITTTGASATDSSVIVGRIAAASVTISGEQAVVKPIVERTSTSASGATNIGSGTPTTTAPSSGFFVSIRGKNDTDTTISISSTVTPGYLGSEEQVSGSVTAQTSTGNIYYLPITSGVANSDTASVVKYATDGSAAGKNIASILGTADENEPTSGYYVAFKGSGNSKVTTAGWFKTGALPTTTSVATYFPVSAASITPIYDNSGLDTYFKSGSSSDYSIHITPQYTNTEGYIPAHSTAINGTRKYLKIKSTLMQLTTTDISGSSVTRGYAKWGTGWITGGQINAATFANTATSEITYKDITNTTEAPMLSSGGFLYINEGYTDNLKISLAKLIPDWPNGTNVATASYILSGYKAYDQDGGVLTGNIPTKTTDDITISSGVVTIPKGYYNSKITKNLSNLIPGDYETDISSYNNSSVTPSVSITSSSTYGFTPDQPTEGSYLTINPGASATNWDATPRATITTAGYIGTGNKTGTKISQKPTILNGTNYYVPIVVPIFSGGGLSIDQNANTITIANPQLTIGTSGSFFTTSGFGVTTSKPDGTSGTDYLTVHETHTKTNGTATSNFTISRAETTYTNNPGVIKKHTAAQVLAADTIDGSQSENIEITLTDAFVAHYIPIVKKVDIFGGGLTRTDFSKTPTITFKSELSTNMSNITIGDQNTTNYPYYFKVTAESSAETGTTKVDRAAVTYSNGAGAIKQKTNAVGLDAASISPIVTIGKGTGNTYVSLKGAALTIKGKGTATKPTLEANSTSVSGKVRVGGTPYEGTGNINKYYMAFKATAPATSISFEKTNLTKGYLNNSDQITCNSSSQIDASNIIYYVPLVSAVIGAEGSVDTPPTATITQSTSMATTTTDTGYYFQINLAKTDGTVYTKYKVTTAGYTPTISATRDTTGNVTVAPTTSIDGNTSKTTQKIYIKKAEGSIQMVAGNGSCTYDSTNSLNAGISSTNTSGVKIVFTGSGSVSAKVSTTAGYTPAITDTYATGSSTSSNSASITRYITGVKLEPPTGNTPRTFKIVVPNGSTTDYIDFRFTVDKNGNVTVDSSGSNTL